MDGTEARGVISLQPLTLPAVARRRTTLKPDKSHVRKLLRPHASQRKLYPSRTSSQGVLDHLSEMTAVMQVHNTL
jgi:hypothetical protein